jgi:hypothetical protein
LFVYSVPGFTTKFRVNENGEDDEVAMRLEAVTTLPTAEHVTPTLQLE